MSAVYPMFYDRSGFSLTALRLEEKACENVVCFSVKCLCTSTSHCSVLRYCLNHVVFNLNALYCQVNTEKCYCERVIILSFSAQEIKVIMPLLKFVDEF